MLLCAVKRWLNILSFPVMPEFTIPLRSASMLRFVKMLESMVKHEFTMLL
jgi:hypothetical protein